MASQKQQFGEGHLVSAREICEKFGTPFDTTAKVLQIMNQHGILSSAKGIKGGYCLTTDLRQVTFSELNTFIEGSTERKNFCESAKGVCDLFSQCNIISPIESLNQKINQYLDQLNLDELLLEEKINHSLVNQLHLSNKDKI